MRTGSLRQRSNGRWQYRASFGSHPDGRPIYRSATFGDPHPAAWARKRAEREATKVRGRWDADDEANAATKGTVAELVAEWAEFRAKRGQSPSTEYRNRAIVARITADLGRIRLADLTARDLDRWYLSLIGTGVEKRLITANTARHYHRVLRAILQQGFKWDLVDRNVADKATPPDHEKHDQSDRMPTLAAIAAMLGKANRTVRMAVLLAAATGCRRAEVVGLRWSDIDGSTLWVRRSLVRVPGVTLREKPTKSKVDRPVPMPPSLVAELQRFRAESVAWAATAGAVLADDGPILAKLVDDPTGRTPYPPSWLSQEWQRLCKRAGVAPFKLHGTRHLHASALHDAGATSAAISGRVGHAQISTTEAHYTHAMPAAQLELAATVEAVFGPLFDA